MNMTREISCQQCYKYYNQTIVKACPFCREVSFVEIILCDLTREAQADRDHIECLAFRPNLSLAGPNSSKSPQPFKFNEEMMGHNISESSKAEWFQAFSNQQTHRRPDDVVFNLKFHLCLVTTHRRPIFSGSERYVTHIAEITRKSGEFFEGTVYLLGNGPDHLHIYIDSTPDYSIQELVDKISASIEREILKELHEPQNPDLFNEEYFVESMGKGGML